jgi:hypothetical protein
MDFAWDHTRLRPLYDSPYFSNANATETAQEKSKKAAIGGRNNSEFPTASIQPAPVENRLVARRQLGVIAASE